MKKVYVLGAFIVGLAAAGFFLLQGTSFDISDAWQIFVSYFRRAAGKVASVTSGDAYKKALDLIAGFEGFSPKAYPDADGYSIGYGHFITQDDPYDSSSVISESEAYTLLEQDARTAQVCVANNVKVALNENQTAALISFVFNIGCGNFQGSTMLRKLNAGDYAGAATEFSRWNKSQGVIVQALITRRAQEQSTFVS